MSRMRDTDVDHRYWGADDTNITIGTLAHRVIEVTVRIGMSKWAHGCHGWDVYVEVGR